MIYDIELIHRYNSNGKTQYQLEEFVGHRPVKYKCKAGMCIDEQGYCPMCGHGANELVIPDQKKYDEWKEKYKNRKIIKTSTDEEDIDFFNYYRLKNGKISESLFTIKDNIAYPIRQLKLKLQ